MMEKEWTDKPLKAGKGNFSRMLSYTVFITWTIITIVPLFWMFYSSFKTNEELNNDIFALPKVMFENRNDEYVVINPQLNLMYPYDPAVDKRPGSSSSRPRSRPSAG